jgi:hypothetical protein
MRERRGASACTVARKPEFDYVAEYVLTRAATRSQVTRNKDPTDEGIQKTKFWHSQQRRCLARKAQLSLPCNGPFTQFTQGRRRMSSFGKALSVACTLWLGASVAQATERSHTSTLKFVYPLGSGDFVVGFDVDSSFCTNANSPKYYYVSVGQNGVAAEGSKKIFGAALTAVTSRQTVSIAFDDATPACYVNRLTLSN